MCGWKGFTLLNMFILVRQASFIWDIQPVKCGNNDSINNQKLKVQMFKTAFALIVLIIGVTSFIGTDTDGDGFDDAFVIQIDGVSYDANHCLEEVLHASNQLTDAGTVEVCNSETQLFVKVTATYGFQPGDSGQVKFWVGVDESLLPANSGGIINGQLPYHSPTTIDGNSWGLVILLASLNSNTGDPINCNDLLYLYIHADVFDLNGQAQTAYGGNFCQKTQDPTNPFAKWYCKFVYQAQCPDNPPGQPPGETQLVCETAFAYGTHVLAWRFNPDGLQQYTYGMKTNRWGWFTHIQTEPGTQVGELAFTIWAGAGRNDVSKADNVGAVVYTYSTAGGVPSVQIEIILRPGVIANEYHAYVGDDPSLKAAAPGRYTDNQYPQQWEGETWSVNQIFTYVHGQQLENGNIIDLIDDDGDLGVWIGLHLSVCHQVPVPV